MLNQATGSWFGGGSGRRAEQGEHVMRYRRAHERFGLIAIGQRWPPVVHRRQI